MYSYYQPYQPLANYNPYSSEIEQYDYSEYRQPPQIRAMERRLTELERRANQLERRAERMEENIERHVRQLSRINQRLRNVERRLTIPVPTSDLEF